MDEAEGKEPGDREAGERPAVKDGNQLPITGVRGAALSVASALAVIAAAVIAAADLAVVASAVATSEMVLPLTSFAAGKAVDVLRRVSECLDK